MGKRSGKRKPTKCHVRGSRGQTTCIIKELTQIQWTYICEMHECFGMWYIRISWLKKCLVYLLV